MSMVMCCIGAWEYDLRLPDDASGLSVDMGIQGSSLAKTPNISSQLIADLNEAQGSTHASLIREFLEACAICHTVMPKPTEQTGMFEYRAASPEEVALVKYSAAHGFTLQSRNSQSLSLLCSNSSSGYHDPPFEKSFDILNVLEFSSERKRMSLIVRDQNDQIILFCKGADNEIFSRTKDSRDLADYKASASDMANTGLRVMAIASRVIEEAEYQRWLSVWNESQLAVTSREAQLDRFAQN